MGSYPPRSIIVDIVPPCSVSRRLVWCFSIWSCDTTRPGATLAGDKECQTGADDLHVREDSGIEPAGLEEWFPDLECQCYRSNCLQSGQRSMFLSWRRIVRFKRRDLGLRTILTVAERIVFNSDHKIFTSSIFLQVVPRFAPHRYDLPSLSRHRGCHANRLLHWFHPSDEWGSRQGRKFETRRHRWREKLGI